MGSHYSTQYPILTVTLLNNTYNLVECYQGSRDNMSIVLVTFLAAPKPCAEAIQKENELEDRIERRITGQL